MSNITINEALKNLFLGLGGDPSQLADNQTVSDYIADLESAIKAAATAELPTPAEANVGKVATVIENEGAYSWGAENVPAELPTPAVGDIGKVVSVVSDGESGAEYSLETPASGGGDDVKTERVISVTVTGSTVQAILIDELTRADIMNFVTMPANTVKMNKTNICAFVIYMSSDYSTVVQGELFLTGVYSSGANNLPIFSGIMPAGNESGALYQMYYMMGATAADDRFEIIPLTTT